MDILGRTAGTTTTMARNIDRERGEEIEPTDEMAAAVMDDEDNATVERLDSRRSSRGSSTYMSFNNMTKYKHLMDFEDWKVKKKKNQSAHVQDHFRRNIFGYRNNYLSRWTKHK